MPNNAFYRRKQIKQPLNANQPSRKGRVDTSLAVTTSLLGTPELGSPSGGPAGVPAGGIGNRGVAQSLQN